MAKINEKNGFEYTHERYNLGSWVVYWKFRPQAASHWKGFSIPSGKAKKADIELFLNDPVAALRSYHEWLDRQGNVELARQNLNDAEARLARVNEPDWGGRGNNPDRDSRRVSDARDAVESAKRALEFSEKINSEN
ncbi:hypothetical protein [Erwinia rhapontici]|uniref:hypothetical protein n=1 Tax=Erwinia rhapontici TaxID=55212 RepID=UPI0013313F47|nr:hypothetical protein [Erwinia rhapontici]MBP2155747.1 hypothetical protein [Erwinia rhapontici]